MREVFLFGTAMRNSNIALHPAADRGTWAQEISERGGYTNSPEDESPIGSPLTLRSAAPRPTFPGQGWQIPRPHLPSTQSSQPSSGEARRAMVAARRRYPRLGRRGSRSFGLGSAAARRAASRTFSSFAALPKSAREAASAPNTPSPH